MLLARFRKRRALRMFRGSLAARLRATYGTKRHYRPDEVDQVARHSYPLYPDYLCYALAMYCDADAFDLWHSERGETCDYDRMRSEIGTRLFGGDTSFDGGTLTDPTHHHGAETFDAGGDGGGDCDGSADGSGFDGGGGGFDDGSCT